MKLSPRSLAAILCALFLNTAHASGSLCELITLGPEAMMSELVRLHSSGETGADYQELFKAYRAATELSDEDLTEAITLQTQMSQVSLTSSSSPRPGEGPLTPEDEGAAQAAFEYARAHALIMQAAFMQAIQEKNITVIRGFLVMLRQGNNICKNVEGYDRFKKDLDLNTGWRGKEFYLEAAAASKEIALLLAGEAIHQPLEKLNGLPFGAEMAVRFIQEGASFEFDKAIPMAWEFPALELLNRGDHFTTDHLLAAIHLKKNQIVAAALAKYPQLATAENADGMYPLFQATESANFEAFELLLNTYKVDVNQVSHQFPQALFPSVTHEDTKYFYALLKRGAQVDIQLPNKPNWTPLHHAINTAGYLSSGDEFVRELLLAGANPNMTFHGPVQLPKSSHRDSEVIRGSWTPLAISRHLENRAAGAQSQRAQRIKEMLEKNGAK